MDRDRELENYSLVGKSGMGTSVLRECNESQQNISVNNRNLELSRSIENATNIINKLQSRMKVK